MVHAASLLTAVLALSACEAGMPTSPAGVGELRSARPASSSTAER